MPIHLTLTPQQASALLGFLQTDDLPSTEMQQIIEMLELALEG